MRPRIVYGVLALSAAGLLSVVSVLGYSRSSLAPRRAAHFHRTSVSLVLRRSVPSPATVPGHGGAGADGEGPASPPRRKGAGWRPAIPVRNTGRLPAVISLPEHRTSNLFGVGTFAAQRSLSLVSRLSRRARLAGAGWVREEFTASRLHSGPDAPYWWGPYDRTVDAERGSGLHILGLLDYSNTWGYADHGTMPHRDIDRLSADFARYAFRVARHFRGRIRYWEIWNEPDLLEYWHPKPRPDDYARLLAAAYRAIKRANPSARVVFGGTSGADLDFIRAVAARISNFDILSLHPYRAHPEDELLAQIRALQAFGKPVWFSEIGWPAGAGCGDCPSQTDQARYLVRFYALAAAADVQRVFWYDFRDDERSASPQELHFGLLRRDLAGKPAVSAYAYLSHLLSGVTFLSADRLETNGLYALRFRRRNGPLVMVWNAGSTPQDVTIPWPGATAVAIGIDGQVRQTVPVVAGTVTWQAQPDGDPVYLVEKAPLYRPPIFARLPPPAPAVARSPAYRSSARRSLTRKPTAIHAVAAAASGIHSRIAPHRRSIQPRTSAIPPDARTTSSHPGTPLPPTPAPSSVPTVAHPSEETTPVVDLVTATPPTTPNAIASSPPATAVTSSPDATSTAAPVTLQPAPDAASPTVPAQAVVSPTPGASPYASNVQMASGRRMRSSTLSNTRNR